MVCWFSDIIKADQIYCPKEKGASRPAIILASVLAAPQLVELLPGKSIAHRHQLKVIFASGK